MVDRKQKCFHVVIPLSDSFGEENVKQFFDHHLEFEKCIYAVHANPGKIPHFHIYLCGFDDLFSEDVRKLFGVSGALVEGVRCDDLIVLQYMQGKNSVLHTFVRKK